jgi:hypothetical protein
MSQFTWWRRFETPQKLKSKDFFKGGSRLLQRIEFGEFEVDPLSEQSILEEVIFEKKSAEINKIDGLHELSLRDMIIVERKKKNKRVKIIMENHLKNEQNRMAMLINGLSKQFNIDRRSIERLTHNFDGTVRHFYFYIKAMAQDRELPTKDDILKMPRMWLMPHRHVLKRSESKYNKLWQNIVSSDNLRLAH